MGGVSQVIIFHLLLVISHSHTFAEEDNLIKMAKDISTFAGCNQILIFDQETDFLYSDDGQLSINVVTAESDSDDLLNVLGHFNGSSHKLFFWNSVPSAEEFDLFSSLKSITWLVPNGSYVEQFPLRFDSRFYTYGRSLSEGYIIGEAFGIQSINKAIYSRLGHWKKAEGFVFQSKYIWTRRANLHDIELKSSVKSWYPYVMLDPYAYTL